MEECHCFSLTTFCLAVTLDPPGDTCSRPSFWVFLYGPLGGGGQFARRRELGFLVLNCFGMFCAISDFSVMVLCKNVDFDEYNRLEQ